MEETTIKIVLKTTFYGRAQRVCKIRYSCPGCSSISNIRTINENLYCLNCKQIILDPVRPQITSSVGEVTSFNQEQVNITIGQNLLTLIDTKLSIKCPANGIPIPKITWTKGNETLPSDGRMTVKNGTLVIVELETSDSGNYTCSSENAAGIASMSSNVTIAGKGNILVHVLAVKFKKSVLEPQMRPVR